MEDLEPLIEPWNCTYTITKSMLLEDLTEQSFLCEELEINLTKVFYDSLTQLPASQPNKAAKKKKEGVVMNTINTIDSNPTTVLNVEVLVCNETGEKLWFWMWGESPIPLKHGDHNIELVGALVAAENENEEIFDTTSLLSV